MPRYGPGQTVAPAPKPKPKAQPKPQPVAPSPEDNRPGIRPQFNQPNAPKPSGKPVPFLQPLGFHGSMQDFNNRLEHVVSSYEGIFGYKPTPGLAFDLTRSPVDDINGLFRDTPSSDRLAKLQQHKSPDFFTKDADGNLVRNSPFLQKLSTAAANAVLPRKQAVAVNKGYFPTAANAQAMGVLPLDSVNQNTLEESFHKLDQWIGDGTIKVTEDGVDLSQIESEYKKIQKRYGQGAQSTKTYSTGEEITHAVKTVKDAQLELNDRMGTDLPVTGYLNDSWLKAIKNWMNGADYIRQVAIKQSQDAGFGNNYEAFRKAMQFKTHAVKKHGWAQFFVNSLPLHLFAHGGGLGITHGIYDEVARPDSLGFSTPLHALTHSATLTLDVVGGGVQQAKAYTAAGTAFSDYTIKAALGRGDYSEVLPAVKKSLKSHPSWMRIFYPDLAAHPKGWVGKIDDATNIAGDIILLRKPVFTGERVAAGSYALATKSPYLNAASHWSFKYLENGKIGRAASMLEGGQGAELFVTRAAPLVKAGKLSEAGFRHHLAELYANGRTVLNERYIAKSLRENGHNGDQVRDILGANGSGIEVTGSVLGSLRTKAIPTPGIPGRAFKQTQLAIRDKLDSWDSQLRQSKIGPIADPLSYLRSEFGHAVPRGTSHFYDPKLPERVHDFTLRHFGDAGLANKFESDLVRFRSKDNIRGIQTLEGKIRRLYAKKYPEGLNYTAEDPFVPVTTTEAPSQFHFPGGGQKEVNPGKPWEALSNWSQSVNNTFNKLASIHRRVIISGAPFIRAGGGMSLFWKHSIGDTLRRAVAEDGWIFGESKEMKAAKSEIERITAQTPHLSRKLGVYRSRAIDGERRWLLSRGDGDNKSFSTGDKFGHENYMTAAGGYLRRRLEDKALNAYLKSSEDDLTPLTRLVTQDKHYQGLWHSAMKADPSLTADDYAKRIWDDYVEIEGAAHRAGLSNPWEEALTVLRTHRGPKLDKALGKFVSDNKLDFAVKSGNVERIGSFDKITGDYIGFLMTANKWNRGQLADRAMYRIYHELTAAGWEQGPALETAMDVGERVTVHHMLDFSNMLQVEQHLRWVSYFATKHRLYWKWVMGTMLRRPGVAATIKDFQDLLDPRGNINFSLFGHKLQIPAARLVWVPGREYSEVSPMILAGLGVLRGESPFQAAKGTFGNFFTRSDTGMLMLARAALMQSEVKLPYLGQIPATYHAAVHGLDDAHRARLFKEFNSYQNDYFAEHGHYAPQSEVVKHVLARSAAEELWRANLPLPIVPATEANPAQKLLRQFMGINDPAKRRALLDQHEELQLYFGIYTDPQTYLHNKEFWRQYLTARDNYRSQREQLYEQIKLDGMTPELRKQVTKVGAKFQDEFNRLLKEDKKGGGTWGKQIEVDSFVDPQSTIHKLFPQLSAKEIAQHVPGDAVKQARSELKLLADPAYVSKTYGADPEGQSELKTRRRELLQFVQDFKSFPSDALGKVQQAYQEKYVNPYWAAYEKHYVKAHTAPSKTREVELADFRKWRDEQDHPVTINGIKFPSPSRMAWGTLDPQTRRRKLALLSTDDWSHLTDYEKNLLGKDTKVSRGWDNLTRLLAAYRGHIKIPGVPALPPGKNLDARQKLYLAKYVEKGEKGYMEPTPGFLQDYLFAQQPKYRRLQVLAPIRDSAYKKEWSHLFADVNTLGKALHPGSGYSRGTLSQVWARYVDDAEFQGWLKSTPKGFRNELKLYGPDLPYTLLN